MTCARHVAQIGEECLLEGKRPLGRPRCRWVDDNKMDLGLIRMGGGIDWIGLAQYRFKWRVLVNTVINL
jgi:hypothetical protein